ncbi:hypothetical protein Tsp_01865 [Trichinella spiralis]|uniref:hypothetical protein n=1 Tax=Trichinella spiralis TaxID=6334 RepID=UPI0001EFB2E1|nr:hypothetical protein Tsp_01865 [Trichinella spiralis]
MAGRALFAPTDYHIYYCNYYHRDAQLKLSVSYCVRLMCVRIAILFNCATSTVFFPIFYTPVVVGWGADFDTSDVCVCVWYDLFEMPFVVVVVVGIRPWLLTSSTQGNSCCTSYQTTGFP